MEWNVIIAGFINSVLVLAVVQILKTYIPIINEKVPWLLPIIAGGVGPIVMVFQNWLSALLGIPIDLSPIAGIFTGATAVALHQINRQLGKGGTK